MTDDQRSRLRQVVAAAAEKAEQQQQRAAEMATNTEPAAVGDLYVMPDQDTDITLSWLVVRIHPDNSALALVVPVDDFPLVGVCDVPLTGPKYCRCDCAFWVVRSELRPEYRVDSGWLLPAQDCRKVLHRLATGQELGGTEEQDRTEDDPEYEAHILELMAVGERLW
jgi:hypothetical protein